MYEIQARGESGEWSAEYCGRDNTAFATREEAQEAIRGLQALTRPHGTTPPSRMISTTGRWP